MGLKFSEFCWKVATSGKLSEVSDSTDIPVKYTKPVNVLIADMKNKAEIFDRINVPYVEAAFDQKDLEISTMLNDKLDDDDIPDGIINKLSEGIFKCKPTELTDQQAVIIKVLSVYICIQN